MPKTLADIRYTIEQRVKDAISNEDTIDWCNDAQSELLMVIEIPASTTLAINTSDLSYNLAVSDIKRINRMWLQSERDQGLDRDISAPYRIYNGQIIFGYRFGKADTLTIEYYRQLTNYTAINQNIDVDDRFSSLYTSYCFAQYYDLPDVIQRIGEQQAKRQYEKHYGRHMMIKEQIAAQYALQTQPSTIKEVWQ